MSDVTERKRKEKAGQLATEPMPADDAKFRAVFEQTSIFAGIMTLDGIVTDANRLCLEACGYVAGEVVGRAFWETGWWRASAEAQERIKVGTKLAADGVRFREVLAYSLADGTQRIVDLAIHPIFDGRGQVIFLQATGVDITDLKRAEENYRKLAETLEAEVHIRTSELERRNAEVMKQSELLGRLSQRLLTAQDEERRRIARDLHDSVGQLLAALSMNQGAIFREKEKLSERGQQALDENMDLTKQILTEVRTISHLLHPPLLDEIGLASALRFYIEGLAKRSTMKVDLELAEDFGRLSAEMETAVFRIVQECLTNAHRHAKSESAKIVVKRGEGEVSVSVSDKGVGLTKERIEDIKGGRTSGVGLRGMRERIRQFGGSLEIRSEELGTVIEVRLPNG
jgi:PAS domain S-box-containing protein